MSQVTLFITFLLLVQTVEGTLLLKSFRFVICPYRGSLLIEILVKTQEDPCKKKKKTDPC